MEGQSAAKKMRCKVELIGFGRFRVSHLLVFRFVTGRGQGIVRTPTQGPFGRRPALPPPG